MIAACPQTRESVPWARASRWEAQFPRRQPHQEALRNLGSAVMGSRETGPEGGLEPGKREQRGLFPVKPRLQWRRSEQGRSHCVEGVAFFGT